MDDEGPSRTALTTAYARAYHQIADRPRGVSAALSWRPPDDCPTLMIRQEIRVSEDPIAQGEISALTRRFEDVAERTDREFGIVKSDLTAVRLQVGNLDQKVGNLGADVSDLAGEVRGLAEKIDRNQAQIVELLTQLIGRDPGVG
jgi:hypothetical protein